MKHCCVLVSLGQNQIRMVVLELAIQYRRLSEQHGGRQETGSRTVLRELGGAGERGDLETVFGDRNHSRVVELLPRLLLRSLHLQPGRWQTQIDFCVLRLFSISLKI